MYHFLYCFDKNYIKQASVSLYSLLENVDKDINVHIISDLGRDEIHMSKLITNHSNLNNLQYYKINFPDLMIYNLEGAHVTEATFYRMFIDEFLHFDGYVTYLDCDIICIKNPLREIKKIIQNLEKSEHIISFNTELNKNDGYSYFKDLNLKSDTYFNAGVMVFNLNKWNEFKVKEKAISLIPQLKNKAIFWDQDILNVLFDGNYYELPNSLNSRNREVNRNDVILHHFSGKFKPWSINGVKQKYSDTFHFYYSKLYKKNFLIVVPNITNGLIHLRDFIKNFDRKNKIQETNLIFITLVSLIRKSFNDE
jgi:UDP-glucose/galactose:(glucosyl)LPS alpha-1,2-glucosyl/galactosyltransferase